MKNITHDAPTDPAMFFFPLRKGQRALYLIFAMDEDTATRILQLADQLELLTCNMGMVYNKVYVLQSIHTITSMM